MLFEQKIIQVLKILGWLVGTYSFANDISKIKEKVYFEKNLQHFQLNILIPLIPNSSLFEDFYENFLKWFLIPVANLYFSCHRNLIVAIFTNVLGGNVGISIRVNIFSEN